MAVREMIAHTVAVDELVALAIVMRVPFAATMAAREVVAHCGRKGGCCACRARARDLPGSCGRTFRRWTRAPCVREAITGGTAVSCVT